MTEQSPASRLFDGAAQTGASNTSSQEAAMPKTLDLTVEEAEYLLDLLYANPAPDQERQPVWSSVRSKVAGRLGKR